MCSVVEAVPYRGQTCPIARELFATMLDVYLVLDKIPETANADTADGRPATRKAAIARLARCLCADEDEFGCQDAMAMADYIAKSQAESLGDAITTVVHRLDTTTPQFIFAGHGGFLFSEALRLSGLPSAEVCRLDRELGVDAARCASAYALARLAAERPA